MASTIYTAEKIVRGINYVYGSHLVISCNKFYGKEGYPVKMWIVKDSFYDGHTWVEDTLFRSTSGAYICMFCRDILNSFRGEEVLFEGPDNYKNSIERLHGAEAIEKLRNTYVNNDISKEGAEVS